MNGTVHDRKTIKFFLDKIIKEDNMIFDIYIKKHIVR